MSVKRLRDVLWLALKDYGHEWVMSGNFVLALAAAVTRQVPAQYATIQAAVQAAVAPHARPSDGVRGAHAL